MAHIVKLRNITIAFLSKISIGNLNISNFQRGFQFQTGVSFYK